MLKVHDHELQHDYTFRRADLTGWKLVSTVGSQTYDFPSGTTIPAGGTIPVIQEYSIMPKVKKYRGINYEQFTRRR